MKKEEIFDLIRKYNNIKLFYLGNDQYRLQNGSLYVEKEIFDKKKRIDEIKFEDLKSTNEIEKILLEKQMLKVSEVKHIDKFEQDVNVFINTLKALVKANEKEQTDFYNFLKDNELQYITTIDNIDCLKTKDGKLLAYGVSNEKIVSSPLVGGFNPGLNVFYNDKSPETKEFIQKAQGIYFTAYEKKALTEKIQNNKKLIFEDKIDEKNIATYLEKLRKDMLKRDTLPDLWVTTENDLLQMKQFLFDLQNTEVAKLTSSLFEKIKNSNLYDSEIKEIEGKQSTNQSILAEYFGRGKLENLTDDVTKSIIINNSKSRNIGEFELTKDLTENKVYCEEPEFSIFKVLSNEKNGIYYNKILPLFKKSRIIPLRAICQAIGENKKITLKVIQDLVNINAFKEVSISEDEILVFFDSEARIYYDSLDEKTKENVLFQLSPNDGTVVNFLKTIEDNYNELVNLDDDRVKPHLKEFRSKIEDIKDCLEVNPESINSLQKVNVVYIPNLIEIVKESDEQEPVDKAFNMILEAFSVLIKRIKEEKKFDIDSKLNAMELNFKMDDLI